MKGYDGPKLSVLSRDPTDRGSDNQRASVFEICLCLKHELQEINFSGTEARLILQQAMGKPKASSYITSIQEHIIKMPLEVW
jgi:hypothetical protein